MTNERLDRYRKLEADLPALCGQLGLDRDGWERVRKGAEGIRNWIQGNHDWALATGRYAAVKTGAVSDAENDGRGAVDDLLSAVAEGP